MRRLAVVVLAAALVLAPGLTSAAVADERRPVDLLLQRRVHDPRLGHNVSFIVLDARTGEVLSKRHPRERMQGASNMKVITAVNALAAIGPATRFATAVYRGADPRQAYLFGGGDPLLTVRQVRRLARLSAPALRGERHVTVHVDAGLFGPSKRAPGWVDAYLGSSVGMVQSLTLAGDRSRRPARTVGAAFVAALRERGVEARLGNERRVPAGATLLASIQGHSVAEAIAVMLSRSDSSIAEVLFRHVALSAGQPPTWRGARSAAMSTLRGLGIDTTGARLVDGSGLSRLDRISPRLMADVLRLAAVTQPARFASIFAKTAMPVAGRSGTLTQAYGRYSTWPSSCARGRVRAKTGTILSTIALSGVARSVFGPNRIFSIIVNDRPLGYSALSTRRAVDGLAATVVGCWR